MISYIHAEVVRGAAAIDASTPPPLPYIITVPHSLYLLYYSIMAFLTHILDPLGTKAVPINPLVLPNPIELIASTLTACRSSSSHPFLARPVFAPLLFPNESSDARDHCANERTFLSWLRLSVYMSIVSVAIIISFHLKSEPTSIEKRIALPVGLIFWLLSLACLGSGLANYVKTVTKYSRRQALVQSGWKTQVVCISI